MRKRFKVRVVFTRFYNEKSWYRVEYAHFRFIPNWKEILMFSEYGRSMGPYMCRYFTDYNEAVGFAKQIKSIDDVISLHNIEYNKNERYVKEQNKIWESKKPPQRVTNII